MPDRPPVFRHPGWKERKPWAPQPGRKDRRVRGRAGQRARAEVLAEEPFCRRCLESGQHVKSAVVDHITPIAWGGGEERSNKQGLCDPCHDAKSAEERELGRRRAQRGGGGEVSRDRPRGHRRSRLIFTRAISKGKKFGLSRRIWRLDVERRITARVRSQTKGAGAEGADGHRSRRPSAYGRRGASRRADDLPAASFRSRAAALRQHRPNA